MKKIDNNESGNGNSIKDKLKQKNLEILEIQNKIKEYKLIVSEHFQCEKKIEYLNKMIVSKRKDLIEKKNEIVKKDFKNNELKSKYNMADKALEILEENKSKKKLKLRKRNYLDSSGNDYAETQQNQLVSPSPRNKLNQKYIKTIPSNNKNVKNQILRTNKNNKISLKINDSSSPAKGIINSYTEEEQNKALSVFSEEEISIIMKMMNNNNERFNDLVCKLVVLERFRNAKEKKVRVKIRKNYNKLDKDSKHFEFNKTQIEERESKKNELMKLMKN